MTPDPAPDPAPEHGKPGPGSPAPEHPEQERPELEKPEHKNPKPEKPNPGRSKFAWPPRRRWIAVLAPVLLAGLLAAAWYGLPVRHIEVSGNAAVPARRVTELAGLTKGFGWLFYGAWRARALVQHPWIRSATITKVFPGTVRVQIGERVPGARVLRAGREVVIDWDGTVLPGAQPTGPLLSGWGPDRLGEAIGAARLLARYNVASVEYTPSGLTIKTASGTLWSGSLAFLQKYAAGVTMNPGKRVNIYPWGVSVQQ